MAAPTLFPSDTPAIRADFREALRMARADRAHILWRWSQPDYRALMRPLPADRFERVRRYMEETRAEFARRTMPRKGEWHVYRQVLRENGGTRWYEPLFVAAYESEEAADRAIAEMTGACIVMAEAA